MMTCLIRLAPSLSVHASVCTWPVTRTRSPLPSDSAAFSAGFSHNVTSYKLGSPSTHSSPWRMRWLTAMRTVATALATRSESQVRVAGQVVDGGDLGGVHALLR